MKRLFLLAMSFGTMSSASYCLAQDVGAQPTVEVQPEAKGGEKLHKHRPMLHILKQLSLSSEQKTQVRAIFKEFGPSLRELRKQMRQERQKVAESGDVAQADEKAALQGLFTQMKTQRQQMEEAIKGVLTDDQSKLFDELLSKQTEKWHKRSEQSAPA